MARLYAPSLRHIKSVYQTVNEHVADKRKVYNMGFYGMRGAAFWHKKHWKG